MLMDNGNASSFTGRESFHFRTEIELPGTYDPEATDSPCGQAARFRSPQTVAVVIHAPDFCVISQIVLLSRQVERDSSKAKRAGACTVYVMNYADKYFLLNMLTFSI
jgi:hypothetical protein